MEGWGVKRGNLSKIMASTWMGAMQSVTALVPATFGMALNIEEGAGGKSIVTQSIGLAD